MPYHRPPHATRALALTLLAAACGRPDAPRREAVEMGPQAALSAAGADAAPSAVTAAPAPRARTVARESSTGASVLAAVDSAPNASPASAPAAAPMLVRTGTASVEVDSLDAAVARVRALAARAGGYVANTSLAAGRNQVRSATLEVRVPAARFDEVVGGLAPFGRVEQVNVTAEDVGEEYVDVAARTANGRRLEARLVELLARRTGKLEDVLEVERELARVREEVERAEGRLRYLRTRAATSTLAVTVHERAPLLAESPGARPLAQAARQAGRNFVWLASALVATSGVWFPLGVAGWAVWRWRRRGPAPGGPAPAAGHPAHAGQPGA